MALLAAGAGAVAFCQTSSPTAPVAEEARLILDRALKDKNPDTRKEAVVALSLAGTGEPFAAWLEAMLQDKDVEVRVAAVASLVDLRGKRSQDALRQALKDEVPEVSFAAAKALWALNDPAGKDALRAVLEGETKAKSGFITKQKRDAMRLMHTPKPMFVLMMKSGAGFVPVPGLGAGVASMMGLLTDPALSGRAAAALLLGKDKDPDTIDALRDALSDKEWSVRAAAVHSLALRNDPAMQPDLEPLLDDKKEAVRLRAAAGYARIETVKLKRAAKGKSTATKK
jgi:HEAT repeat protein